MSISDPLGLIPRDIGPRWRRARNEATNLLQLINGGGWLARVQVLDQFLWYEARASLSSDQVTAVINRQALLPAWEQELEGYLGYAEAVLSTVLTTLGDALPVREDCQALTLLLSDRPEHGDAAEAWLAGLDGDMAALLGRWPGHAFTLLARHRTDSWLSLLARDGFRMALLGQR
jgi:hypothetical protein